MCAYLQIFSVKLKKAVFICCQADIVENIDSSNLLNLIYVIVFGVETALENAEFLILEQLELQIFFASSQPWWRQIKKFSSIKFSGI